MELPDGGSAKASCDVFFEKCSGCDRGKDKYPELFEEGFATCTKCRAKRKKRSNRNRNKEKQAGYTKKHKEKQIKLAGKEEINKHKNLKQKVLSKPFLLLLIVEGNGQLIG